MNCIAASNGVSIGTFVISPGGGELNLYPPQKDLSASGGLKGCGSNKVDEMNFYFPPGFFEAIKQFLR